MIIRARVLVPMVGPAIADGAITIDGNHIRAVGTFDEMRALDSGKVIDLPDCALLPGLINAHCHLDYTTLRHAITPPSSFTTWVKRINALKRELDTEDYLQAIDRGFTELRRWGTTSVCNIEAFPELMPRIPPPQIRTWWFYEMIDIRHRITTDDVVAGALSFFENHNTRLGSFGLSPHAPYTASQQLYHLAKDCASIMEMPLTTHVAESREETLMFRDARGPLYEFLDSLQRPMTDCGRTTPFRLLWESGSIDERWILAHMNELSEEDFELLAKLPLSEGPHIVHCPGSHRYFGHSPFPLRRLHDLGVNLCIGTDSLASTDSLSLFRELRRVAKTEPWLGAAALLRMVTVNPAKALRRGDELGRIAPGALADLIALPVSGNLATVHDEIVEHAEPIPWMMIDGKVLA